jgi:hypothetical protein
VSCRTRRCNEPGNGQIDALDGFEQWAPAREARPRIRSFEIRKAGAAARECIGLVLKATDRNSHGVSFSALDIGYEAAFSSGADATGSMVADAI